MNLLAFDQEQGEAFDANFISIYNEDEEDFEYYVQRITGIGIENEEQPLKGAIWQVYINDKREDWSMLCKFNRIICKEDRIYWKYEMQHKKHSHSDSNDEEEKDELIEDSS